MQYLVVMRMRDHKDSAMQEKREANRPAHIENATRLQEQGHLLLGGAILDEEGLPAGSAAVAQFDTRAELDMWLANDPWAVAGVWQDVEVIPFRIAPHYLEHLSH